MIPGCPTPIYVYPCPSGRSGVVDVTKFDLDPADGVVDSHELQCAIDCLDGEPMTEAWLPSKPGPPTPLRAGATLVMSPSLRYLLKEPVYLPWSAGGPLTIRGNGAILQTATSGDPSAMLQRVPPLTVTSCDVAKSADGVTNWLIENLVLVGEGGPLAERMGLRVVGSRALSLRNCRFEDLRIGAELRAAQMPTIEGCQFEHCVGEGLRLADGKAPCDGDGLGCWSMQGCRDAIMGASTAAVRRCDFVLPRWSTVGVRLSGVINALIDQPEMTFDAGRSIGVLIQDSPAESLEAVNSRQVIVRDAVSRAPLSTDYTFIRNEGSGQCIVQGLHQWTSQPGSVQLYDGRTAGIGGQDVIFDGLLSTAGVWFAGQESTRFSFRDVQLWFDATRPWREADLRDRRFWPLGRPSHVQHEHFESPDMRADCKPAAPVPGQLAYFDGAGAAACPPGLAPPAVPGLYYWGARTAAAPPEWLQVKPR